MRINFSVSSNACTAAKILRARASGWPMSSASFTGTADKRGPKAWWTAARRFIFQSRGNQMEPAMNIETTRIKNILLVEDDLRDVELTLAALEEHHLANKVLVVHDGAEALDYLYHRGKFKNRASGNPVVMLLDNKMPKVSGLEVLKAMK